MYRVINVSESIPRHPTRKWQVRGKISRIIVHCTGSSNQDPFKTARYHITPGKQNHISKKGAPSLCYHDFVVEDGCVYHCNDYEYKTWHAGLYNRSSIGLVMATKGLEFPTPAQYESMVKQVVRLCMEYKVSPKNVMGHREVPGMFTLLGNGSRKYKKWCPGKQIDLVALRKEVTQRMQRLLAAQGLYTGAIDGIWGKKSKAALKAYK